MTKSQLPHQDNLLAGYFTCLQNPTEASPTLPTSTRLLSFLYHTSLFLFLSLSLSLSYVIQKIRKKGDMKRGLDPFVA
jgi:hypothetical protein